MIEGGKLRLEHRYGFPELSGRYADGVPSTWTVTLLEPDMLDVINTAWWARDGKIHIQLVRFASRSRHNWQVDFPFTRGGVERGVEHGDRREALASHWGERAVLEPERRVPCTAPAQAITPGDAAQAAAYGWGLPIGHYRVSVQREGADFATTYALDVPDSRATIVMEG